MDEIYCKHSLVLRTEPGCVWCWLGSTTNYDVTLSAPELFLVCVIIILKHVTWARLTIRLARQGLRPSKIPVTFINFTIQTAVQQQI